MSSIILAKMFGLYLIITGAFTIFNRHLYEDFIKEFEQHKCLKVFGGAMAVLFGSLIIAIHNLWVFDWRIFITLLGWASLIKGIVRLFADKIERYSEKTLLILGGFSMLLGLYLSYIGFILA